MGVESYLTQANLERIVNGYYDNATIDRLTSGMITTKTNGIEGLPYQFPPTVDRRATGDLGRKYGEKIFSRLPLLFLTPCKPEFMKDFDDNDKSLVASVLAGLANSEALELLKGEGRYYSTEFDYDTYYRYLNTMLACVSSYMGLYDTRITIPGSTENNKQIGKINWKNELNPDFKTFHSCGENIIFYLDSFDSVSESVSNSTVESSLASQINGFSDQVNELRFLFGSGGATQKLINAGDASASSSISQAIMGGLGGMVGGKVISSIASKGVDTILDGGKIIFPEIWNDSDFSRSFNLELKLRSPDNDNLSIFLNIIKPYCKLLCLAMPRQINPKDPNNSYGSPFLVRAYSKGMFNIDMGIITGLSVNKGATGQWNDDGLPTQLDISIEIKDLYSNFAISAVNNTSTNLLSVAANTAYMDFLANMAGLNVGQMEMGRRISMAWMLGKGSTDRLISGTFNKFSQSISRIEGYFYGIT